MTELSRSVIDTIDGWRSSPALRCILGGANLIEWGASPVTDA